MNEHFNRERCPDCDSKEIKKSLIGALIFYGGYDVALDEPLERWVCFDCD